MTQPCTPSPPCPGRPGCTCSIAAEEPAIWAAVPAGSGATAGAVGPAIPADNDRMGEAIMNARTMAGGFAAATIMTVGIGVGGFGYAAAQPGDYSTLPVDPNLITDSQAYSAAPAVFNPNGQPGIETVYTHRDGSRTIASTILVLPDAQAATAALDGARAHLAGKVANGKSQPAAVCS